MFRFVAIVLAYIVSVEAALVTWYSAGQIRQALRPDGIDWPGLAVAQGRILTFLAGPNAIGIAILGGVVALPIVVPILIAFERFPRARLTLHALVGALAGTATFALALFGLSGGAEYRRMVWEFDQGRYANYGGQFADAALAGLIAGVTYGLIRRGLAASRTSRTPATAAKAPVRPAGADAGRPE